MNGPKHEIGERVIMTTELFVNGELTLTRKESHGKSKQTKLYQFSLQGWKNMNTINRQLF